MAARRTRVQTQASADERVNTITTAEVDVHAARDVVKRVQHPTVRAVRVLEVSLHTHTHTRVSSDGACLTRREAHERT